MESRKFTTSGIVAEAKSAASKFVRETTTDRAGVTSIIPNRTTTVARELNKNALRREEIREEVWPNSSNWIWDSTSQKHKGFVGVSRLMPWIAVLIRHLSEVGDPSGVYWEFWCRHMGQGLIEVKDEEECAYAAGYISARALRTWNEHVLELKKLKFIDYWQVGRRKVGYVLLTDPLAVAVWYNTQGKTPSGWWTSFKSRAKDIGADVPSEVEPSLITFLNLETKATLPKSETNASQVESVIPKG